MARFQRRIHILSIPAFQERFGTHEQCAAWLVTARWPSGFLCPGCGRRRSVFITTRLLYQCTACRRQSSLTAGTLFHKSRVPLHKWFWAIYRLAQDKKGCSALLISKEIDVSYPTAWLMAHKIRQAMLANSSQRLLQQVVELDDTYLGGCRSGRRGRGASGKTPLLVAVEALPDGRMGQAAIEPVRQFRQHRVNAFAQARISRDCTVCSDRYVSLAGLANMGYRHRTEKAGSNSDRGVHLFPRVHLVISNLKRFILGRHHAIAAKHAVRYVGEFLYRFNHRWKEGDLFERLAKQCAATASITYPKLIAAELR